MLQQPPRQQYMDYVIDLCGVKHCSVQFQMCDAIPILYPFFLYNHTYQPALFLLDCLSKGLTKTAKFLLLLPPNDPIQGRRQPCKSEGSLSITYVNQCITQRYIQTNWLLCSVVSLGYMNYVSGEGALPLHLQVWGGGAWAPPDPPNPPPLLAISVYTFQWNFMLNLAKSSRIVWNIQHLSSAGWWYVPPLYPS